MVHAPRDRTRVLVRAALPRRHARLTVTRSVPALERRLRSTLVDAVLVDLGAPLGDPLRATALAREFPSIAFLAITPYRPVDAPAIAACVAHEVADVLADAVDDALLGRALVAHGFSSRFAAALDEPPPALRLTSVLQRDAWCCIVQHAGRVVRTRDLARSLAVTREHLSRTFAAGAAASLKRVIDLVRLLAAAELAKNPGFDLRDVARMLGYASTSHLSAAARRLVGRPAGSLARLRGVELIDGFVRAAVVSGGRSAGRVSGDA